MDAELIGAVFAGIIGLVTAVFGYLLSRAKARDEAERESDFDALRRRFTSAIAHIYQLRALMSAAEVPVPTMPADLDQHSHPQGKGTRR